MLSHFGVTVIIQNFLLVLSNNLIICNFCTPKAVLEKSNLFSAIAFLDLKLAIFIYKVISFLGLKCVGEE